MENVSAPPTPRDNPPLTSRRRAILGLCAAALCLVAVLLLALNAPTTVLTSTDHGAQIRLEVANAPLASDCMAVRWTVDNITSLELNGHGVVGAGETTVCADVVRLDVNFRDGSAGRYTVDRLLPFDSLIIRILLTAALALLILAVGLSGVPQAIQRRVSLGPAKPIAVLRDNRVPVFWAAVAIVLVGAVVRGVSINRPPRGDESWTVIDWASKPLPVALSDYSSTNNQPFNTVLVYISITLFGLNVWAIHLPSMLIGTLVIPAAFAVGRRFYNSTVGLFGAALCAGASWLVAYSVDARGYSLVTLLCLLLLCVSAGLLKRRSLRGWVAFAALCVAGLYTVLSMVYAIGIASVWLGLSILYTKRGRARWLWLRDLLLTLVLVGCVTTLLYAPALRYVQTHDRAALDVDTFDRLLSRDVPALYASVAADTWNRFNLPWTALQAALIVGCVSAIMLHGQVGRSRVSLAAAAVAALVPAVFIPLLTTYPRVWVFLQPLYFILGGAGLVAAGQQWAPWLFARRPQWVTGVLAALAMLLVFGCLDSQAIYQVNSNSASLSAEDAVLAIRRDQQPGDQVLCNWFCPAYVLQGRIHHLELTAGLLHDQNVAAANLPLAPGQRLYLVTKDVDPASQNRLRSTLEDLDLPADALAQADVLADLSDSVVYRLTFTQPLVLLPE